MSDFTVSRFFKMYDSMQEAQTRQKRNIMRFFFDENDKCDTLNVATELGDNGVM